MRVSKEHSIKHKLIRIIMITTTATLLLAVATITLFDLAQFRATLTQELIRTANITGLNSAAALEFGDSSTGKETLNVLQSDRRILSAAIYTLEGDIFAVYQQKARRENPFPSKILEDGKYLSRDHVEIFQSIIVQNQKVGTVYIRADLQDIYHHLEKQGLIAALILLLSSLLAYALSFNLQNRISQPLLTLAETADKVSLNQDYSIRAVKQSQDEIGFMVERFNEMLSKIEKHDAALKQIHQVLEDRVQERTLELQNEISVRKNTEKELTLAMQQAEKASRAKSGFLSSMSHELRTPLNAVIGFSQLLTFNPTHNLEPNQLKDLQRIIDAGNHLLHLINDVLSLSHIESENLNLLLESVSVKTILKEVQTLVNPMAEQAKVTIYDRLADQPDLFVHADKTRFKQIILNLVTNAIKYNRKDGSVTLNGSLTAHKTILLSVEDTGIGIPPEKQHDLFQPFNRLDIDPGTIQGTGIGLSITKGLVEKMNGKISIKSVHEQGSCFSIELPQGTVQTANKDKPVVAPLKQEEPDSMTTPRFTVLYIEDNLDNILLVRKIITYKPQIDFLSASEAEKGIEMARSHLPDLIFMDINMPQMDGITAFKKLRACQETSHIPIIALSADALDFQVKKVLREGFSDYIVKPIDVAAFLKTLDSYIEKARP